MGKTRLYVTTLAIVVLCSAISFAKRHDRERTVQCESQSGRYSYCRTYTTGTVELRKQLSKKRCTEYDTWGADGDGSGIWVRDGCRAVFTVRERSWGRGDRDDDRYRGRWDDNRYGGRRIIRCASESWAYNHCDVPGGPRDTKLVRQISHTRCVRGDNWGEDRYGIWVDRGCEAEFEVRR
jgi:hypothetical protein